MVRAYVRGTGEGWTPNDELEAVVVTATARLITNPGQIPVDQATGPCTQSLRGSFTGWTLAELFVLYARDNPPIPARCRDACCR
jgi:hypothetical protein